MINLLKTRDLSSTVEAVVQISAERYRLTFNNARQMQAFSNQDFLVHGKPVEFRSVSPFTWVYISRLSYGIPDEAITRALAPYSGGIKTIKSLLYEKIYDAPEPASSALLPCLPCLPFLPLLGGVALSIWSLLHRSLLHRILPAPFDDVGKEAILRLHHHNLRRNVRRLTTWLLVTLLSNLIP